MRVCVTGGSGFIGHKLIFRCLKLGYEVRYLTRSNNCLIENAIAYIGNVNSAAEVLLPFFKDVNIFYHCAGEVNDLANMWSTHVQGTINLLSIIEKSRFSNQAFFHWENPTLPRGYWDYHYRRYKINGRSEK